MNLQKIEKEDLHHLHFVREDVLQNDDKRSERNQKLIKACILGNVDKEKCRIIFHSREGCNYIETTVWAVTEKYICLKGGVYLMVASIVDVIL